MKAFLTGSHAYGSPTDKSDIDLVVLGLAEDLKTLMAVSGHSEELYRDTQSVSLRFGKLNLLFCLSLNAYHDWYHGTEELKGRAERLGPRPRDEAVEVFSTLRQARRESERKDEVAEEELCFK
jgi:hypothetical protein